MSGITYKVKLQGSDGKDYVALVDWVLSQSELTIPEVKAQLQLLIDTVRPLLVESAKRKLLAHYATRKASRHSDVHQALRNYPGLVTLEAISDLLDHRGGWYRLKKPEQEDEGESKGEG